MNPISSSASMSTSKDAVSVEAVPLKFETQLSVSVGHIANQALVYLDKTHDFGEDASGSKEHCFL